MLEIEKKITERVPWVLVAILSAFLGALGTAWVAFLPRTLFSYYNFGEILCILDITSAPFILLLFASLYSKLTKKSISPITLTYLYVIGMTCSWYVSMNHITGWIEPVMSRNLSEDWSLKMVPWFMAPSPSITSQLLSGHVPIPWGDWLPSTLYHWSVFVLLGFFYISIATLFRRQWINVESVPFPHTLMANELLKRIPGEKPLMEKLGKPFLIGIVLGLVYQIPVFLTSVFPWFPDIYGWKTLCLSGQWFIPGSSTLASIAGLSAFQEHPAVLAVAYLAPLSISFNAWFWQLVYMILMQVAYAMGYYTGIESEGGCGRAWCSPSGQKEAPFKFQAVSLGGGLIGVALITLILSRRYISETFRAAITKHSNRLEIEKDEPLTYRNTYVMLVTSLILLIMIWMLAGLGIVAALLLLTTFFLFWFAYARFYGLAGLQPGGSEHGILSLEFYYGQQRQIRPRGSTQ